jgi:hypothetical protein
MSHPLKRPRDAQASAQQPNGKRVASKICLTGGPAQPPRIIGYRRTGANVDVHVRVEGRLFEAHSKVLAASSAFFDKIVTSGDAFARAVELPTPSATAFDALLEFMYTGECSFAEALLVPFIETAHHLRAPLAIELAMPRCAERLAPHTCCDTLRVAQRFSLGQLQAAAEVHAPVSGATSSPVPAPAGERFPSCSCTSRKREATDIAMCAAVLAERRP